MREWSESGDKMKLINLSSIIRRCIESGGKREERGIGKDDNAYD